ncbi:NmrA family protein [Aciduricibacillus chroicocephali]|uniref:NmrA family protein n=1 Tax=Aciduricibacillus chroicocephali TaxID=3054939 RepID=UPI003266F489
MDVILADNFARAAKENGVKKIIYLTGIIPEHEKLSRHLESRLEVEEILGSYGTPVTAIRSGLIVGPKGSSFPILSKLVKRLPVMLLPKWAQTPAQPTALPDVIQALDEAIRQEDLTGRIIEVGGPEVMAYRDMMKQTAELLGRNPKMFDLPVMTPKLSRLWVTLITGAPKIMVYPLIESLPHNMIVGGKYNIEGISIGKQTFREAAKKALDAEKGGKNGKKPRLELPNSPDDVRSVQRIVMPHGCDALWISRYYVQWIGRVGAPLLSTHIDDEGRCTVSFALFKKPLLEMTYSKVDSTEDRALYYITGGLLAKESENKKGRLEFRRIPGKEEAIVAIHDYLPSLPWFFYHYTQAKIHLLVMAAFRIHVKRLTKKEVFAGKKAKSQMEFPIANIGK